MSQKKKRETTKGEMKNRPHDIDSSTRHEPT